MNAFSSPNGGFYFAKIRGCKVTDYEWLLSPEEELVLCQSPTSSSDLGDITIVGEEGEDDGWLN